jgi:hypothetical protein
VFTETKHEEVGDAGCYEGMEAPVAEWVVNEKKTSDQRVDMSSCMVRNKKGTFLTAVGKRRCKYISEY